MDTLKRTPVKRIENFALRLNLTSLKRTKKILRLKQTNNCFYFLNSMYLRGNCVIKMLIINQNILELIFRKVETYLNILNFLYYLLWSDNKVGWALPHKHFWTVPTHFSTSIRYYYNIIVAFSQLPLHFTTHTMHDELDAGKKKCLCAMFIFTIIIRMMLFWQKYCLHKGVPFLA